MHFWLNISVARSVRCLHAGIDDRVWNVNGYVVSLQQLYGIDAGRRAFMLSEDDGLTWYSTSSQRFAWAASQGTDFVAAVTVPWVQGTGLTSAAALAPYVVASWGGRHEQRVL